MKAMILLVLLGMLTSCKACKEYVSMNGIEKGDILFENRMEGSPVVINGELYHVISDRFETESIQIFKGNALINSYKTKGHLISAFVENDVLYIFSTVDNKEIVVTSSSDSIHFAKEEVIYTSNDSIKIFNTSAAKDDSGYVLAFEICKTGNICFNTKFIIWTSI